MSIDIAPELSEILAYIKEDVDNGSDTGSDTMMDRLEKVLTPVFEELSKTRQRNVELETELSGIDLVRIESVISRLFEVMSDISREQVVVPLNPPDSSGGIRQGVDHGTDRRYGFHSNARAQEDPDHADTRASGYVGQHPLRCKEHPHVPRELLR